MAKKKYSINYENDQVVSVDVNGVHYRGPDEIPDPADRARIQKLMPAAPAAHLDELEQGSSGFAKIILSVFLGVTILMLAITAISAVIILRTLSKEQNAAGRVVGLVNRTNSDGSIYTYPMVEFTLPNETQKTVQLSEGSWPPAYERGQPVTVLYNPEQPLNARIKSTGGMIATWTVPLITGVLGAAFLVATFFARWILKSEPVPTPLKKGD